MKETKIIKADGKCSFPPNNNNNKCDCGIEKFENGNNGDTGGILANYNINVNDTLINIFKIIILLFIIYLVYSYITNK
jgi:hypothetical protein